VVPRVTCGILIILGSCLYLINYLSRQTKIMNAYFDDKIYSVELVGAVLRQESFVRQMHDLGWTRQRFFDAAIDELALHHALTRYHA
jgi:hypothetical protein